MDELDLQAAELLERTAEALESGELTWGRGQLINNNGHVCAVGALRMVGKGTVDSIHLLPAHVARAHRLAETHTPLISLPKRGSIGLVQSRHLATWNDQKATGVGDVIELFKTTAKEIRNGQ